MGVVLQLIKGGKTDEQDDQQVKIGSSVIHSVPATSVKPANDGPNVLERHNSIRREIEEMLKRHGVDFSSTHVRRDVNSMTWLAQGVIDKSGGNPTEQSCMLDTIGLVLDGMRDVPPDDGKFDDLLGKLQ
jgi:hypothetical protein